MTFYHFDHCSPIGVESGVLKTAIAIIFHALSSDPHFEFFRQVLAHTFSGMLKQK